MLYVSFIIFWNLVYCYLLYNRYFGKSEGKTWKQC